MTPASLPEHLLAQARARGSDVALREKRLGLWRETSWSDYARQVACVAAGLRDLGVRAGDRVAVHADNRREWVVADLAIQSLGAITIGVDPDLAAADVAHRLARFEPVVLVAGDREQLDTGLAVRAEVRGLRELVVIDARGVTADGVRPWAQLEAAAPIDLAAACRALDPDAGAIVVQSAAGATRAREVVLTHADVVRAAAGFCADHGVRAGDEILSHLPLSDAVERLVSVMAAVKTGCTVNFARRGERLAAQLREVQPTVLLGPPQLWEGMRADVELRRAEAGAVKRIAWRAAMARGGAIGHLLAFRALRERLGLLRVRVAICVAAAPAPEVVELFARAGVQIGELGSGDADAGRFPPARRLVGQA